MDRWPLYIRQSGGLWLVLLSLLARTATAEPAAWRLEQNDPWLKTSSTALHTNIISDPLTWLTEQYAQWPASDWHLQKRFQSRWATEHQEWQLEWQNLPIFDAIALFHQRDESWFSSYMHLPDTTTSWTVVPANQELQDLWPTLAHITVKQSRAGWCWNMDNTLHACAEVEWLSPTTSSLWRTRIDATNGAVLSQEELRWDVTSPIAVTHGEVLDGSDESNNDLTQVAANFSAAFEWFRDTLNFDFGSSFIQVVSDAPLTNNAQYIPATDSLPTRILLGRGDGVQLRNLSSDPDVVTHELGHHIIYEYIKTAQGDSGVLHEGMADYFTYVMMNRPILGTTLVPDRPYLRTAILDAHDRYDQLPKDAPAHQKGQYWSALLWRLRDYNNDDQAAVANQMLHYLPPQPTLRDALVALLHAQEDAQQDTNALCFTIEQAIELGFSDALRTLDGERCHLQLEAIANARDQELAQPVVKHPKDALDAIVTGCGVTPSQTPHGVFWIGQLLLWFPLLFTRQWRRLWNSIKS